MAEGGKGVLVHSKNYQVDLFLIDHEEVSVTNDISDEGQVDMSHLSQHVALRPIEVTVSGKLLPSKYGGSQPWDHVGDDIKGGNENPNRKPLDKLNKIVKMCNDMRAGSFVSLTSPAFGLNYERLLPVDFNYENEGEGNAIPFSLTLEEIGMREELKRGEASSGGNYTDVGTTGLNLSGLGAGTAIVEGAVGSTGNPFEGYENRSRYHASIKSPTEDGGGQRELGTPSVTSLNELMNVESLDERVENKSSEFSPKSTAKIALISRLIGAEEELSTRSSVLSFIGHPDLTVAENFGPNDISGDVGTALNVQLDGVAFPSTSPLNDRNLEDNNIIKNIPSIGPVLAKMKNSPDKGEFVLEATQKNRSTILTTMRSPVMQRMRNYIIEAGSDVPNGVMKRLKNKILLSTPENRILKDAFIEGVDRLREVAKSREGLNGFVASLPQVSTEDHVVYYNYYGQPVMSFEGTADLSFERWSTQMINLNGETYEVETYWNKAGFPVFTIKQPDGTRIVDQSRAFLGTDLLHGAQFVPSLEGVHLIPFSIDDTKEMDQEKIGESIFFMIVYTNKRALKEVL